MQKLRLGRTELTVGRTAFGALPIQRLGADDAVRLLRQAFEGGIDFFDTARGYTDSEEKLGLALSDVRDRIFLVIVGLFMLLSIVSVYIGSSTKNAAP